MPAARNQARIEKNDIFTYLKKNTSERACAKCGTKVKMLNKRDTCERCSHTARQEDTLSTTA